MIFALLLLLGLKGITLYLLKVIQWVTRKMFPFDDVIMGNLVIHPQALQQLLSSYDIYYSLTSLDIRLNCNCIAWQVSFCWTSNYSSHFVGLLIMIWLLSTNGMQIDCKHTFRTVFMQFGRHSKTRDNENLVRLCASSDNIVYFFI